jgi:hypothetical protein
MKNTERRLIKGQKRISVASTTYSSSENSQFLNNSNYIDLKGLKSAESELCAKKFKELLSKKETDVETNSKQINFIAIPEKTKKVVTNEEPIFFKEV